MGFFAEDEGGDEFAAVEDLAKEADQKAPQAKAEAKPEVDDKIPVKYRGKSVEDIIRMHQEAETLINRHSEEVGFARKMAEAAAKRLESDNGSQAKRPDADQGNSDIDFFAHPKQTVEKTISEHPDVVAARQAVRQTAVDRAVNYVKEKLGKEPKEVINDPDFFPWAQENPFRLRALQHAEQTNDAEAALEILQNFEIHKERKAAQQAQQQANLTNRQQSDKRAVMVDGGSPSQPETGKIYRASDLRKLQRTDPAKYEKFEDEILLAYSQGRVKFD